MVIVQWLPIAPAAKLQRVFRAYALIGDKLQWRGGLRWRFPPRYVRDWQSERSDRPE
jgi:hypothetical protein